MNDNAGFALIIGFALLSCVLVSYLVPVCATPPPAVSADTGIYRGSLGEARLAIDGVDIGAFSPTHIYATKPSVTLFESTGPTATYCVDGIFRVEWAGHEPTRDGDACVWRCEP